MTHPPSSPDMETPLLPCPFCGGKAAIVLGMKQTVRTVDVACQDCGGAMPAFCEEDAVGDWNIRTGSVAQSEQEPVAWLYETWCGEDHWSQRYSDTKPTGNKWERNIRPLYLATPTSVSSTDRDGQHMMCCPASPTHEGMAPLTVWPSTGSFLGYRDASGNEMHCRHMTCPHEIDCRKRCICPTAVTSKHPRRGK